MENNGGVVWMFDEEKKDILVSAKQPIMDGNYNTMAHVHIYNGMTTIADDHQHVFMGVSGPADQLGTSHAHLIATRTSFSKGHWHWIDVLTGPMSNDNHTHYLAGRTSTNNGHFHKFSDITNLGPDSFGEGEEEVPLLSKPCRYKYNHENEEEYN